MQCALHRIFHSSQEEEEEEEEEEDASSRSIRRRRSSSCSNATHGTTWGRWETIVQGAAKRAKGGTGAARWQLRAVRRSSRVRNSSSRREALGAVHSLRVARRQLAHTSSLAASTTRKCLSGRSIPSRFCAADGVACRWRTGNFDCFLIDITADIFACDSFLLQCAWLCALCDSRAGSRAKDRAVRSTLRLRGRVCALRVLLGRRAQVREACW